MKRKFLLSFIIIIAFSLAVNLVYAENYDGVIQLDTDVIYYDSDQMSISGTIVDEETNTKIISANNEIFLKENLNYFTQATEGSFTLHFSANIGRYTVTGSSITTSEGSINIKGSDTFRVVPEIILEDNDLLEFIYPVEDQTILQGSFVNEDGDRVEKLTIGYLNEDGYSLEGNPIEQADFQNEQSFGFLFDGDNFYKPGKIGLFADGVLAYEGVVKEVDTFHGVIKVDEDTLRYEDGFMSISGEIIGEDSGERIEFANNRVHIDGTSYNTDANEGRFRIMFRSEIGKFSISASNTTTKDGIVNIVNNDNFTIIPEIELDSNNSLYFAYPVDNSVMIQGGFLNSEGYYIDSVKIGYVDEDNSLSGSAIDVANYYDDNSFGFLFEGSKFHSPGRIGIFTNDCLAIEGEVLGGEVIKGVIKLNNKKINYSSGFMNIKGEIRDQNDNTIIEEANNKIYLKENGEYYTYANNGYFDLFFNSGIGEYSIDGAVLKTSDGAIDIVQSDSFNVIPELELLNDASLEFEYPLENQQIIEGVFKNSDGLDFSKIELRYLQGNLVAGEKITEAVIHNSNNFGLVINGDQIKKTGKIGIFVDNALVINGEIKANDLGAKLDNKKVFYGTGKTTLTTTFELVESHNIEIEAINPEGYLTLGEVTPYGDNFMDDYDAETNKLKFNFEPKDKGKYEIHVNLVDDFIRYKSEFEVIVTDPSVIFDSNGGADVDTITQEYNTIITSPANPTRSGYDFIRWEPSLPERMPAEDMVVKAIWKKKVSNSPSPSPSPSPAPQLPVMPEEDKDDGIVLEDDESISKEEKEESGVRVVEIKSEKDTNDIKATIKGSYQKELESDSAVISLKSNQVSYNISSKDIKIEEIAKRLNIEDGDIDSLEIDIEIKGLDEERATEIRKKANDSNYEVIFEPISFNITSRKISEDGEVAEEVIDKFDDYIERVFRIPEGIDPEKVTTGVVYRADGSFTHAPTTVYEEDGVYYAKVKSLTNSIYTLISNEIEIESVENHWAKTPVNALAKKLVIKEPNQFNPEGFITRGSFAEYITKAIGVYSPDIEVTQKFTDVDSSNEYSKAILIANDYGIVSGYPDGSFKPEQTISRQEAMAMFANAMEVIKFTGEEVDRIEQYKDKTKISDWAYESVKNVLAAKVFNGKSANIIAPKDTITYAEAASAIWNLLVESELIDR